jgi:hypothetical protein
MYDQTGITDRQEQASETESEVTYEQIWKTGSSRKQNHKSHKNKFGCLHFTFPNRQCPRN